MSHGIAISTYLMDGSLTGPRYMKIEGGRLRLFVLPRDITTKLSVKEYPEYDTPCVYVLTGEDNGKKAYVGQSNAFINKAGDIFQYIGYFRCGKVAPLPVCGVFFETHIAVFLMIR